MAAGDRFKSWIESLSNSWKDRLGGWVVQTIAGGVTKTLEDMEPGAIESFRAALTKARDNPLTPPEMVAFYNKALTPGNWLTELIAGLTMAIGAIPALMSAGVPLGNLIRYFQDKELKTWRLDPAQVITAWRRDPGKYAQLFDDLKDQGWNDARIDALKFITLAIPNAADIVRFALREVYTPEIAEKYGQFQDIPAGAYPDAEKAGLSVDMFNKYWAAHWGLPSASDGFELLHRGILTEAQLKDLLKANDIMPYWRDQLIKLSWNIPTRVDVRRFWDMRTIDESRLREIYTGLGYHGQDLEDYVLWTKIYVDFPDLLARYKNGWITIDQVKGELVAMGMKPERADTMIEEKIKKAAPERTVTEKNITKTDIIKGVKTAVITRAQGVELLQDLGYDRDEAVYILEINIPADEEEKVVTERQLTKSDVLNGLRTEVISASQAREKLLELRYKPADVDFLLKVYQASIKPPVEMKLKEASKADVLLGVKKGLITPEEGYRLLLDMDFTPDAAGFILMVHAEESPFSPMSYDEFKDLTQKYRLAAGMEGKPMTEEIKKLGAEVVRLTADVAALNRSIKEEQGKLVSTEGLPVTATARVKELQATLYKAQAELSRVTTDYNAKVAEWRHGSK